MRALPQSGPSNNLPFALVTGLAYWLKVEVKDSGGTWRDLSTYPGFDAVLSANWKESIDDPHATAEVVLLRELDDLSLAPLMDTSAVNLAFTYGGTPAALLDVNRELRIKMNVTGSDAGAPLSSHEVVAFHGRIDTLDAASEDNVVLTCRDLGGQLADSWIETERAYAFCVTGGVSVSARVWKPSTTWALNEYVIPSEAKRNGRFYKCTTAGAGGTTEPAWPTSGTVADSSAVWTYETTTTTAGVAVEKVMQNILNDNGFSSVVLYVPTAPTWSIKPYLQSRTSVLSALKDLAVQIGWDVRFKWRSGTSAFELTFFQPDRAKSAIDYTFGGADYARLGQLRLDVAGIRNVVLVVYPDASDLDPAGNPKRKTVTSTDSTSVSRFGRRFMEISEADVSQVDTSTEAQAMADAARKDLAWPKAEQTAELCFGFPWAELGDLYRYSPNGRHYSSNQDLAVTTIEHAAANGVMTTTLGCRGAPAGAYQDWHDRSSNNARDEVVNTEVFTTAAGASLTATPVVGGVILSISTTPLRGVEEPSFEFHIDTSSATFTPSSSTLKTVSKARIVEVANLIPGVTYYARFVPVYFDGGVVRGLPSDGVSFVAGRGFTGHLNSDPEYGRCPLNGGFETRIDTSGPPDHWAMLAGTWGTNFSLVSDSSGVSGDKYLKCEGTGTSPIIRSADFLVDSSAYYTLSFLSKSASAFTGGGHVKIQWLDYARANISTSQKIIPAGTSWARSTSDFGVFVAPSNARFAYVFIEQQSVGPVVFYVDQIRLERSFLDSEAWQSPSLQNSWVDAGGGYRTAGYRMDKSGRVHLRGLIKDGTTTDNTILFTLPVGYRPGLTEYVHTINSNAGGTRARPLILLESGGDVRIYDAATYNAWLTISGISFDAN